MTEIIFFRSCLPKKYYIGKQEQEEYGAETAAAHGYFLLQLPRFA